MKKSDVTSKDKLKEEFGISMAHFWEAYRKLLIDMDNLNENQFHIRQHEMWEIKNKTLDGHCFLISLYSMSEKAEKLYGAGSSENAGYAHSDGWSNNPTELLAFINGYLYCKNENL